MVLIQTSRRGFIGGLAALCAAPAIVKASSLMRLSGESLYAAPLGGNSLLTIDMITREAVKLFKNSAMIIDALHDEEFGMMNAKIGTTLRIRLPNEYKVNSYSSVVEAEKHITLVSSMFEAQVPVALAVAGGAVLAAAQNPVVSRRFWTR